MNRMGREGWEWPQCSAGEQRHLRLCLVLLLSSYPGSGHSLNPFPTQRSRVLPQSSPSLVFLRRIFPFASPRRREHFSGTVLLSWQQKQQLCLLLQVTQQIQGLGKVGTWHGLQLDLLQTP